MTDRLELAERVEKDWAALPERITRRLRRDPGGCWNWSSPNSLIGRGRGYVSVAGKPMLHHRAIWTLARGPIPEGALLCHHCDNPRCGNPSHLYIGSHKSNVGDMWYRRRAWQQSEPDRISAFGKTHGAANNWSSGERNPKAKLTPEQVAEIRESIVGSRALGRQYGVDRTTIQRIRKGALWTA